MSRDPRGVVTTHILTSGEAADLCVAGLSSCANVYGSVDVQRELLWIVSALGIATQPPRGQRARIVIDVHRMPGAVESLAIVYAQAAQGAAGMSAILSYMRSIGVAE